MRRSRSRLTAQAIAFAFLWLLCTAAVAQTRAWLDRDRIALGETTTLNVETDLGATPDYAPLLGDFVLGGQASQQQLRWVNGKASARALYAVALRPRRDGLLRIPALRVGGATTSPITLLVTPAAQTAMPAGRADVFIESEADTQAPYVQQSVGWVVRLYSAVPLIAGRLDQDEPPNASLQRVGDDLQYRRSVGGRDYVVTERRYLLIPERSGELVVPPARFDGRGSGGLLDRMFGDGEDALHAVGRPRVLTVRPIPADAPQPWLPLRALSMRYVQQPRQARAGEAATVVVELTADGAGAAQLPALELPGGEGVQVFAERAQSDESVVDGRPQARLQRRFNVVPSRAGRLEVAGPEVAWWDSRAGVARVTRLPPLVLQVAPSARTDGGAEPDDGARAAATSAAPDRGARLRRLVPFAAAALALLAVIALALAARRRKRRDDRAAGTPPDPPAHANADSSAMRGARDTGTLAHPVGAKTVPDTPQATARARDVASRAPPPSLADALARGELNAVDTALRTAADAGDLDAVIARLDDPAQREAVEALRRARWAGGDAADALARVRSAFASGARWRAHRAGAPSPLPPLYPDR